MDHPVVMQLLTPEQPDLAWREGTISWDKKFMRSPPDIAAWECGRFRNHEFKRATRRLLYPAFLPIFCLGSLESNPVTYHNKMSYPAQADWFLPKRIWFMQSFSLCILWALTNLCPTGDNTQLKLVLVPIILLLSVSLRSCLLSPMEKWQNFNSTGKLRIQEPPGWAFAKSDSVIATPQYRVTIR